MTRRQIKDKIPIVGKGVVSKMAARIEDVAEKAGVAVATVSRVMNNRGAISEKTRNKVWQAIEELDYHPSQIARNLQSRKTFIVGVIVPDVGHNFFAREVRHLEAALCEKGYKMMLCNAMQQKNLEMDYIHMLQCNKVDGIILASHTLKNEFYEKLNLPLVSLDRYLGENIPVVTSDHGQGGIIAGNVLKEAGCHFVVQICGDSSIAKPSDDRHVSMEQFLAEAGIECRCLDIPMNVFEYSDYKKVTEELFDRYPEADGVFCVDNIACAVLQEAYKRGIPVPERLKVVGYDGNDVSRMTIPVLTTVKQQLDLLAGKAVDILMDQINGERIVGIYKIPVVLAAGDSV